MEKQCNMATTNWNVTTIDGQEYLVMDSAEFRIPLDFDPSSNMFVAVAASPGGLGNFPTLSSTPVAFPAHDGLLYECPRLWVSPEFIEYTDGWSWWYSPLESGILHPWGTYLWFIDSLNGRFFVHEAEGIKTVWRIIEVDVQRNMLLGSWPE